LKAVTSGRVFGMFASSHMDAEIDRQRAHPNQPTLQEMTEKAIAILSQDPDGFFLMVEGSQIDWACHANDPAHLLSDMLAYDKAVKSALEFAQKDGNTLVLALSDHNTGGFSIGNYRSSENYSQMSRGDLIAPFSGMNTSAGELWKQVEKDKTPAGVIKAVKEGWGIGITDAEAKKILEIAEQYKSDPYYGIGEVVCPQYTYVGWATHGHSGGDVPLYAFGPGKPAGALEAPDIGKVCAQAMGLSLSRLNDRLFADPAKLLKDAAVVIDKTDAANPVVKIDYKGKKAELPVNKNILKIGGAATELEGVVVYAEKKDKAYVPMQAIRMIAADSSPLPPVNE
jgi:alkaline phosphatase